MWSENPKEDEYNSVFELSWASFCLNISPLLPSLTLQSLCLGRHHCLPSMLQKVIHSHHNYFEYGDDDDTDADLDSAEQVKRKYDSLLMEISLSRKCLNRKIFKVGSRTWYLTSPETTHSHSHKNHFVINLLNILKLSSDIIQRKHKVYLKENSRIWKLWHPPLSP